MTSFNVKYSANNNNEPVRAGWTDKRGWLGWGCEGAEGHWAKGVATKINRKPVANIVCCEVSVLCSGYSFWFLIWLFSIGLGPRLVMGCGFVFRLAESGIQSVGIESVVLDRHGFPAAGTRASGGLGLCRWKLKSKSQK